MPVTYKFATAPEFDMKNSKVILTFEDFYKLMELAQDQLNCPIRNSGHHLDIPKGANQQIYIDKLIVDNTKQSSNQGIGQPLHTQQSQLNASFANLLSKIGQISHILKTTEGQRLGTTPLQCLSLRLANFNSASLIFSTRTFMPKTVVAEDFHKACDNVPNVLVIIKSGQYIAGGFTAVAFESHGQYKPNANFSTFLFSLNRQKVYPLKNKDRAILCYKDFGPIFGCDDVFIQNNYADKGNYEYPHKDDNKCFDKPHDDRFGAKEFAADEYEVYRLQ